MIRKKLLGATEIAEMLGVSKSKAYTIIRSCNEQLEKENYMTIAGKVPMEYFADHWYGIRADFKVKYVSQEER